MLRNSPTALRVLKAAMNADEDGQAGIQLVSNPDVVGQENGLRRPSKHSVRMARLLSNAGEVGRAGMQGGIAGCLVMSAKLQGVISKSVQLQLATL
eukprot:scaffold169556_cov18-Tisochrysis_lutea.AAC.1